MASSDAHSADLDMTFVLPSSYDFGEGRDLGVCLLTDSCPIGEK